MLHLQTILNSLSYNEKIPFSVKAYIALAHSYSFKPYIVATFGEFYLGPHRTLR